MGDVLFIIAFYIFFGFITNIFVSDHRTPGKVSFGVFIIWPLFLAKSVIRAIKASSKGPMFVVGAVRGAMRELRDL